MCVLILDVLKLDFHKPVCLISLSVAIKSKKASGWRGSPICRNIDSRHHHIKKEKGHDFKAKGHLRAFSVSSKPQWTLRVPLYYKAHQQCDGLELQRNIKLSSMFLFFICNKILGRFQTKMIK